MFLSSTTTAASSKRSLMRGSSSQNSKAWCVLWLANSSSPGKAFVEHLLLVIFCSGPRPGLPA